MSGWNLRTPSESARLDDAHRALAAIHDDLAEPMRLLSTQPTAAVRARVVEQLRLIRSQARYHLDAADVHGTEGN